VLKVLRGKNSNQTTSEDTAMPVTTKQPSKIQAATAALLQAREKCDATRAQGLTLEKLLRQLENDAPGT
jgi:hypothetical protein